MKKIRVYYWIGQSILKKYFLIIISAALIGAFTFTQSEMILGYLPKIKQTQHVGRVGLYTLSNLPLDVQQQVSDGLTTIDSTGAPVSDLASNWNIIDDGKTYVFTLKEGLSWQDGTPFNSQDINYNFEDVIIEKPDEKTVVFKLSEPFTPFPSILSQPLFKRTSTSYLQTYTINKIIGTGKYTINKVTRSGSYIQKLHLESEEDNIIYNFYNTESAAISAFKLGEVDRLEDITNLQDIGDWDTITIDSFLNKQRMAVIFFNTQDPEKNLTNKSIRQALAYATPKTQDHNLRALGPISPDSWAYNPRVKPYDYSLESALDLLKDVNTDFELTITTTPTFSQLAEEIKASWEQLGITVKIKVSNIPDTTNYQVLIIGQQIPKDPDQYQLWHSTQESNITGYQSAKVDKLLEDGRKQLDTQKRKIIYQDFQRFLLEDSPAVFLNYLESYNVTR